MTIDNIEQYEQVREQINQLRKDMTKYENANIAMRLVPNMNKPDEDIIEWLADVDGSVEATSCEKHMLWERYVHDEGKTGYPVYSWVSERTGHGIYVGRLGDFPVYVSLYKDVIRGKNILFYDATSLVVHHDMVRDWMERNVPNWHQRSDADNFSNVFHGMEGLDDR